MDRFYSKVRVNKRPHPILGTPCHEWTACKQKEGYGRIMMKGQKVALAHRVIWELKKGPIPTGKFILHKCDNPACVNLDHLFCGTKADNNQDAWDKGRQPGNRLNGENLPWSKLKEKQVKVILRKLSKYKRGMVKELAKKYNVNPATITQIKKGRNWTHLRKERAYLR